jgi:thiol-disulfide isomerase/thioredoxin
MQREDQDYFGPNNRYVKELTPKDFDSIAPWKLKDKGNGIMMLYAPWCHFCKALKPDWEKAAQISGFCNFYAFNCEKHKSHLSKIREDMPELVTSYPTIIIYKNGEPVETFNEDRTVDALVKACMRSCVNGKCSK